MFKQACENGVATYQERSSWGTGSSDIGDLSSIMPICHPNIGGCSGRAHGNDFVVSDFDSACVTPVKIELKVLEILLCDGAERANRIVADYEPVFKSKEEYFAYMDNTALDMDAVTYNEDSSVTLRFQK